MRRRLFERVKDRAESEGLTLKAWVERAILMAMRKPEPPPPKAKPRWPMVRG